MSDEAAELERNFRSSYYHSLGFRGGEKSLSQLEGLIKAEILDVKKLKSFCLKHTLPVYYRPHIWKLLLGVVPVYTDKNTCTYVREQKKLQFQDLKHALQILGRLEHTPVSSPSSSATLSSSPSSTPSPTTSPSAGRHSSLSQSASDLSHAETSAQVAARAPSVPMSASVSASDMVTIYLLENDRLLTAGVNQLKQKPQVDLCSIAKAFLTLFEEEEESDIYWLFSGFVKKWEMSLEHREEMKFQCLHCLEEEDCVLYEHLKDLDALDGGLPLERWFGQSFANELPESCLEIVWDRVVGGSRMVLVFVAVAILLSLKRKILGLSSIEKLIQVLETIPEDNFTLIVSKAIDLWESRGSPLYPPTICDV